MRHNVSTVEAMAAAIQLIIKKPRTVKEIGDLLGLKSRRSATNYIAALRMEGLVEEDSLEPNIHNGKRFGPQAIRYRWVRAEQE